MKRVPFDAVFGRWVALEQLGERVDVTRADVSLIGPRMNCDAVRARVERLGSEPNQARDFGAPGITQRRDLVDVYGQPRHTRSCSVVESGAYSTMQDRRIRSAFLEMRKSATERPAQASLAGRNISY